MKNNKWLVMLVAGFGLASLTAKANPTGFGPIPGVTQAQNPYSGNGIPIDPSVWEQTTLPSPNSQSAPITFTMALSTSAHGSSNPTPGNNGVDTFFVNTGQNGSPLRSLWNLDFYSTKSLGVTYMLTVSDGYGRSVTIDPSSIGDNVGGPGAMGNSESLDFAFLGGSLSYNPFLDDTYYVDFSAKTALGSVAGDVKETIVAGAGHNVPDGGETAGLLAAGLGGLFFIKKQVKKIVPNGAPARRPKQFVGVSVC